MSGYMERHSHIAVTGTTADGSIVHTDVEVVTGIMQTHQADARVEAQSACESQPQGRQQMQGRQQDGTCFDPDRCDARERALIMAMRAYLRPQVAPECLMRRLRETLDHCCRDSRHGDE